MKNLLSIILLSLPCLSFSQGNLDLTTFNYIFVDSLDNNHSENRDGDVKGYYDALKVRTMNDVTTFTFNLREGNQNRTATNTEETYTYQVIENGIENDTEFWVLLRKDGIRLIFDHNKTLNSYSLTIPVDEMGEELYVYIFTKTK